MNTAATAPAAIRLTAIQHNLVATLSDGQTRDREELRAAIGRVVQYPHHLKPLLEAGLIQAVDPRSSTWRITDRGSQYLSAWRDRRGLRTAPADG